MDRYGRAPDGAPPSVPATGSADGPIVRMLRRRLPRYRGVMEAGNQTVAMLLTLAGLVTATTEYAHIVRRRTMARPRSVVEERVLEASGLPALVRVFIVSEG